MNELEVHQWAAGLVDLSHFGVTIRPNPNHTCCVCGASTVGWTDGYGLDNACRNCSPRLPQRRQSLVFTEQTVRVTAGRVVLRRYINPLPNEPALHPRSTGDYDDLGMVLIQGHPLIVHASLYYADLYDPATGNCFMEAGLRMTGMDMVNLANLADRRNR